MIIMQKLLAVLIAAAALFVLWVGVGLMMLYRVSPQEDTAKSDAAYVLKSSSGRAVLFTKEGEEVADYGIYVNLLPEADRQRLKDGINIDNRAELSKVLEDLGI
jgi:hypothetical protein